MADIPDIPDSWILVWFADNSTACVHRHCQDILDHVLNGEVYGDGAVGLECLDGATVHTRCRYIQAYIVSTPETRTTSRAFEKARKEETKASKSWDDEE